jgi:chromosome segregation ATPase
MASENSTSWGINGMGENKKQEVAQEPAQEPSERTRWCATKYARCMQVISNCQREIGVLSERIDDLTTEANEAKRRRDAARREMHANQGALGLLKEQMEEEGLPLVPGTIPNANDVDSSNTKA